MVGPSCQLVVATGRVLEVARKGVGTGSVRQSVAGMEAVLEVKHTKWATEPSVAQALVGSQSRPDKQEPRCKVTHPSERTHLGLSA